MGCKTTFTNRRKSAAFTLIEMLVASSIGSVVMTAVAMLIYFTARSYSSLANYVDLDQQSRNALDHMTLEIRQADSLYSFTTNQLIFVNGGLTNLSYTYSSTNGTLTRSNGNVAQVLLTGCTNLVFTIFGRCSQSNAFDQFPTTNAANAKLIKIDWTCSRQNPRQKINTENMESAKIVIRKQGG